MRAWNGRPSSLRMIGSSCLEGKRWRVREVIEVSWLSALGVNGRCLASWSVRLHLGNPAGGRCKWTPLRGRLCAVRHLDSLATPGSSCPLTKAGRGWCAVL